MPAESMSYECRSQTSTNRLNNPDSRHLMSRFIITIIVLSTGMILDQTARIAGHVTSMTTYYSHFEIAEYLIDQVASLLKSRSKKLPLSHCIRNRNEAI